MARLDEIQQSPGVGSRPFATQSFSQEAAAGVGRQKLPAPPRASGRLTAGAPLPRGARSATLGRLALALAKLPSSGVPSGRGHAKNLYLP